MNVENNEQQAVGTRIGSETDLEFQRDILPGVSRTFALTIPVLPPRLADVVANAYLLCRLADTIEDDVGLTDEQKSVFHERFVRIAEGSEAPEPFAEVAVFSGTHYPANAETLEHCRLFFFPKDTFI